MKRFVAFFCALLPLSATSALAQSLVLVSIDGFRWDYMDEYPTPNLNAIAAGGVRATKMMPIFPSKTFPGHLSIVTGLTPAQHGIVDNNFCDSERGECYKMADGGKDSTWLSGIPLWNLVEMHGHKAASYFWPESDARVNGMHQSYHYHYSHNAPNDGRVAQVVDWLNLPEARRPRLVTTYFSLVDSAGHEHGPISSGTAAAVAEVDRLIGELWAGIQAAPGQVNLMVVSDHGMVELRADSVLGPKDLPEADGFTVRWGWDRIGYTPEKEGADVDALSTALTARAEGRYRVLDGEALMALGHPPGPRTPAIMIEAIPPGFFSAGPVRDADGVMGTHGFAVSAVPEMAAFLVAAGPAFKVGATIPEVSQLDVYPVAAKVLDVAPLNRLPSDGGKLLNALKTSN